MADRLVSYSTARSPQGVATQRVFTKQLYADEWTEQPLLWAERITWQAAPGVSTASLAWRFGEGLPFDEHAFRQIAPFSAATRPLVKIAVTGSDGQALPLWVGRIEVDGTQADGAPPDPLVAATRTPYGRQQLVAYGLEHALQSVWLDHCFAEPGSGGLPDKILRGLTFNEGGRPNRSASQAADALGGYVFARDPEATSGGELTAKYWSSFQIARYLLARHAPADATGTSRIPWTINDFDQVLPDDDRPTVPSDGRTLRELLDSLIPRQRLAGWYANPTEDGDRLAVELVVFTYTGVPLTLPSGRTLPGSSRRVALNLDDCAAAGVALKRTALDSFDQVVCRGARRRTCFTAWQGQETIEAGWTTAEQTAYDQAASTAGDYPPGTEVKKQQQRNREARTAEELAHVYTRFLVATPGSLVGDGIADGIRDRVVAPDNAAGTSGQIVYERGLTVSHTLPLLSGIDYTLNVDPDDPAILGRPPYRELPFLAFAPVKGSRWRKLTEHGSDGDLERDRHDDHDHRWSVHLHAIPDSRGLVAHVSGAPQHTLGLGTFAGCGNPDTLDGVEQLDWRTIRFTVAVYEDRRCEGVWPATLDESDDEVRRLVFHLGDDYRTDYLVPGTIVDLTEASQPATSPGGYCRDDGPFLLDVARTAFGWYGQARAALDWQQTEIRGAAADLIWLGDYVTQLGDPAVATPGFESVVDTVVTRLEIIFPRVLSTAARAAVGPPTLAASTQCGEFDPIQFRHPGKVRRNYASPNAYRTPRPAL